MTDFPDLKIRTLTNFPSQALGRTGIDVVKTNGNFYLDLNYADFQITPNVPAADMPNSYNLIWDEVKKTFAKVPFALQATGGVSSLAGQTGAIAIDPSLQMAGSTLKVAPFSYVASLGGKTGAITIDSTLAFTGQTLSVVNNSSATLFDTRAAAIATSIPAIVTSIIVRRYTSADPLSDAPYKRGSGSAPLVDGLGNTWSLDLSGGTVNALWFGVKGDGVTVNDAAWQAAVNAAVAIGGKLLIPPGSFKLTTALTITGRVTVEGVGYQGDNGLIYGDAINPPAFPTNPSGWLASVLVCGTGNGAFAIATRSAVSLRDFQVLYPARPAAGTVAIAMNSAPGTSGVNTFNSMRDLCIIGADKAMAIDDCLGFVMDGVIFLDTWDLPLQLSAGNSVQYTGQTNAASFGDSTIVNCHFMNTVGPYHLLLLTTGGLRIVNNKFNQTSSIAILIAPQAYTDPVTGAPEFYVEPLIITGNSIEGSPVGIQFQPNSTSHGTCNQATISGNQIWATTACISFVPGVVIPYWVYDVAISGNVLLFGSTAAGTETGISVNGVESMTISGNSIVSTVTGNVAVQFPTADYAVTHKIRMSGNVDSLSTPCLPGEVTPSGVPGSGVVTTNYNPHPVAITVTGGTKTGYVINGVAIDQTGGSSFTLRPGDTIAVNYSAGTPTWHWYAINP